MCYITGFALARRNHFVLWCNVSTAPGRDPWIWDAGKQERHGIFHPKVANRIPSVASVRHPQLRPGRQSSPLIGQVARLLAEGGGRASIVRFRDFLERPRLSGKSRPVDPLRRRRRNAPWEARVSGAEYEFPADTGRCLRRFISDTRPCRGASASPRRSRSLVFSKGTLLPMTSVRFVLSSSPHAD